MRYERGSRATRVVNRQLEELTSTGANCLSTRLDAQVRSWGLNVGGLWNAIYFRRTPC